MTILLVRHAESKANLDESLFRTTGDHNIALSDTGHEQAKAVGAFVNDYFLKNPPDGKVRLWASPYLRTTQTAQGLLENAPDVAWDFKANGQNIFFDARLREREFGYFDGLNDDEIPKEFPVQWQHYRKMMDDDRELGEGSSGKYYARPYGGESAADVTVRLHTFLETLWRDMAKGITSHVIVNHGFTLRCFVSAFFHGHPSEFLQEKNPSNTAVRLLARDREVEGEEKPRYRDAGYIYDPRKDIRLT